jgi:anti-sigma factor RsiW
MSEMVCNELVGAITAYLEGSLSDSDRRRFDAHIAECSSCTEYLAQMRETIDRLGNLDERSLTRETREGIIAAFRDWRAG